ncbi:MAG: hypothetical protein L3J08_08815 [Flavobacteriaceae bacterium]|nr:hypothetical protein [Flavobacteriaceae bacterium]
MLEKEKDLLNQKEKLLSELTKSENWIIGSIIETTRIQSGKKKPFNYLSRSLKGKTQTTYISKEQLNEFKKARELGSIIQVVLNEIIEVNIKLLKLKKAVDSE